MPQSRANLLISVVSAARKPSSWVPPSWVLMVLANVCTDSVKPVFHCIATSSDMPPSMYSDSASKDTTVRCTASLRAPR